MRLVSLCPSLTELVFDLGLGPELVGITEFCVHPRPGVEAIEKVGGTKSPAVERILALEPDLVLLNEEENRREDADALAGAGLACHVSYPRTVEEAATTVRSIGCALGRSERAEAIGLDIEQRAERVRRDAGVRRTVSWAYLIWRRPWMSVNSDTYTHALLALAGGRNVLADRGTRYPELTAAELALASPERVLLGSEPFPFRGEHADELAAETGLERSRFKLVDGEMLSWHGSRTPRGIDYAESLIHSAR